MKKRLFKFVLVSLMTVALVLSSANETATLVKAADNYVYFLQDTIYLNEDEGLAFIPYVAVVSGYWGPTAYISRTDITADFGVDYHISTNKVSPRYAGTYGLMTLILEDTLTEGDEEYVLTFTSGDYLNDPANGYYGSCTVVIVDNEAVNPPDSSVLTSTSMTPMSCSISSAGGMSFEIQHIVEITDTSTAGFGWELYLNLDDIISLAENSVDDPSIIGTIDYIQASIPTLLCLSSITLTSLEFPDNTLDDTDVVADLTNLQSVNSIFSIKVAEDDSGDTGVFTATLKIIINFYKWLPAGTIITAGGNGSRFDGNPDATGDNDYMVQSGDKIQIFAGDYNCNIEYEAVRPSTP